MPENVKGIAENTDIHLKEKRSSWKNEWMKKLKMPKK